MFIVDDILLSPFKGMMWILREIHNAVQREQENESEALTQRLTTLYMALETGQITPDQFDEAEAAILARLDELKGGAAAEDGDDPDDDGDDVHETDAERDVGEEGSEAADAGPRTEREQR